MKNTKKLNNKIDPNALSGTEEHFILVKILLLIFLMASPFNEFFGQKKSKHVYKVGGGVESFISGNSHGTFYSTYVSVGDGKNFLYGGPVIQKRSMLMEGGKIGYSRVLTGGDFNDMDLEGQGVDGSLQLNFFCTAQYVNQSTLSYSALLMEQRTHTRSDIDFAKDWSKVKLSTAEVCAGFELHLKITQNISWKNYIGASVYSHLNYIQGMYHEKTAPVLIIGTGICIKHF